MTLKKVWHLQRVLAALEIHEASEILNDRLRHTKSNKEFLDIVDKTLKGDVD
jgi:transcription termination factor Rho